MEFTAEDTARLLRLMAWRRDERHFRPDPVTPEQCAQLRRAMDLSPSVGNSRPWRVVSVEDAAVRAAIIADHEDAKTAAETGYDDARRARYRSLKLAALRDAPLHLAVFTDLDPAAGHGLGRRTMPETLAQSTVIAIHGLWLAARSMNLGVGWVSILNPEVVARLVGADEGWRLTAYLCVGRPSEFHETPELERVGWQESESAPWIVR